MFHPKPKTAKIRSATLSAILADIEALHQRVHELAYDYSERPTPEAPPSPSSAGLPAWYSQRSMPAFDQPPWYTHEYPGAVRSPRFERGPASPGPVFRRRGGEGARGAHGTPRVTRVAPDRRGRGVGRERRRKKKKRVRGQRAVEESEETESGSEESEEDGDGDGGEEMRGDGGRRDGRGGRFGGRGVAV